MRRLTSRGAVRGTLVLQRAGRLDTHRCGRLGLLNFTGNTKGMCGHGTTDQGTTKSRKFASFVRNISSQDNAPMG